jgi:arylsulfatase A-like enzyme
MPVSRRTFLLSTAASALAGQTTRATRRPSIVLIIAEDLPAWLLGCYGNREIRTPNIDLLARSGSRFVSHTATSPSAAASRATLLTGRVPRQHGVRGLPGETAPPERIKQEVMFSDVMANSGAKCGFAGKWDLGGDGAPQHGFTFWRPAAPSGDAPENTTRDAVEFLNAQQTGERFFLVVSYAAPQPPYGGHPAKFDEMYASAAFDTFNWLPASASAAEGKEYLQDYLASMRKWAAAASALDSQIPPVVEALDKRNLRDRTLIVFTSTNGLLAGRRGLWRAGNGSDPVNLYAEGIETPMIWNWPGTIPVEGERTEIAAAYDLVPSLEEAAVVAGPDGRNLCGRSYFAAMINKPLPREKAWRNLVLAAHGEVEMARDARYKLVLRDRGATPGELYDLRADAHEITNQYNNERFLTVRGRLTDAIRQWREQYS